MPKGSRSDREAARRLKRSVEFSDTLEAIDKVERIERCLEDVYESMSCDIERLLGDDNDGGNEQ